MCRATTLHIFFMSKIVDRTGIRYGKLIVLKFLRKGDGLGPMWLCRCDCGKELEVSSNYLKYHPNTKSYSCGCGKFYKWGNPERGTINSAWAGHKNKASSRKLVQELSFDHWLYLTQQPCHYCGVLKSNRHKSSSPYGVDFLFNGIDRKDSAIGYTLENSVSCCSVCNMSKRLMSESEFLKWVVQVYNHLNSKKVAYTGI